MNARTVLFWLLALLITAGVVGALSWPLLRRRRMRTVVRREVNVQVLRDQLVELENDLKAGTLNQEQYEEARTDISRRLLEDLTADPIAAAPPADPRQATANRRLAAAIAVLLPVCAVGAYLTLGTPAALDFDAGTHAAAVAGAEGDPGAGGGPGAPAADDKAKRTLTPEKIQAMIDQLRKKLEAQPNDAQGAAMLARALNFIGKFPEAVDAYRKALPLNPNDAELMADYADALAMTQNRTLGPEPMKLVQQALRIDPQNMKALALAATEAFQRKDYRTAIDFWKRAIPAAQQHEPELAQQFRVNIAEANQLGGGKLIKESDIPGAGAAAAPVAAAGLAGGAGNGTAAAGGPGVSGRVTLAPALQSKVAPGDSVFIYAKAANGPPMPLAVMRARAQDLPMEFHLDDSMAMVPGMKVSGFPALVVGARISRSGNAIPASGDLQGQVKNIKPGASDLKIEISEVLP